MFDADEHYYEPLDAFTRHLDADLGPRTVQMATVNGRVRLIVGGRVTSNMSNPTFNPIVKPGALVDFFRGNPKKQTIAECLANREPLPNYYRDRDARVAKLDEQGVAHAWILPTMGMAVEEGLQFDPEGASLAFKAFNRWVLEDWGFNYKGRIFAAPYLAMGDRDAALAEVEWALDQGARIFVVRPSAVYTDTGWHSPADPWFDPIWARIEEAGVTVVPHVAEVGGPGLDRYQPYRPGVIAGTTPPLQVIVGHERPIANYLGAIMADKLFERFPRLRIASVENGADFLPLFLAGLERAYIQRPGYFNSNPVETFKEHVWIAPFWEDRLDEVVKYMGADRVLFGSDWPHPEGMVEPLDYLKIVDELGDPVAERKIMYENSAQLTGL